MPFSKAMIVSLCPLLLCVMVAAPVQRQSSAGITTRIDKRSGLKMVLLPQGHFPELAPLREQPEAKAQEKHEIVIGPLWFAATDVTAEAYAKCAHARACSAEPAGRDEPMPRCTWRNGLMSHPINCVSWMEAAQFCQWIGGRLPTATEWEYAATSGGPEKTYPWGEAPPDGKHANYCDVNCPKALGSDGKNLARWEKAGWIDRTQDDGWAATSPAGSYPAGATVWGLLDMAGNVWQWTSSEAGDGKHEVRGGSWDNAPASLQVHKRLAWPDSPDAGMGFRCVKDPAPQG